MRRVTITSAGPGVTVQDDGWRGTLALGLSQGGVADRRAYAEAGALLGHPPGAVLEMAGMGVTFQAETRCRLALTGEPMRATSDGQELRWNAVHLVQAGHTVTIGSVLGGVYGYVAFGGGLACPQIMGSCSTHRASGLGHVIKAGDCLRLNKDPCADQVSLILPDTASTTAPVRMVATAHTALFSQDFISRFEQTLFTRAPRGNRQGVALDCEARFTLQGGRSIVSETVLPGDIQLPGDGFPLVLLADCQTTGGYPRLASVLPCDLPRVVQAAPGDKLVFKMIDRTTAIEVERAEAKAREALTRQLVPICRDPADISDLLRYQLISGVTNGEHQEEV